MDILPYQEDSNYLNGNTGRLWVRFKREGEMGVQAYGYLLKL
jgi:hypothetical protein